MNLATAYLCEGCGNIQDGAKRGACEGCGSEKVVALAWRLRDRIELKLWQDPLTRRYWRDYYGADRQQ